MVESHLSKNQNYIKPISGPLQVNQNIIIIMIMPFEYYYTNHKIWTNTW